MSKERLIAFTDAVLAIIMTILVLELKKPSAITLNAFYQLRWNFFAYALSFFWLGSLWMGLNSIWDKANKINNKIVWWTLVLLFVASFIPYTTSLVGSHFNNNLMESIYGLVVILMTLVNYHLHKILDEPNQEEKELLAATSAYRHMLIPDLTIKGIGQVIACFWFAPAMMIAVFIAAGYVFIRRKIF